MNLQWAAGRQTAAGATSCGNILTGQNEMQRIILFAVVAVVFNSCLSSSSNHSTQKSTAFSGIHRGMNYLEVLKQIGFPSKMDDLGTITDSLGFQTHTIQYIYGTNIIIT